MYLAEFSKRGVKSTDREAACLIGEEVAIDFVDGHENKVSADVVGFLRDILHGVSSMMAGTCSGMVVGVG
jgi:hypothetical protein